MAAGYHLWDSNVSTGVFFILDNEIIVLRQNIAFVLIFYCLKDCGFVCRYYLNK